MIVFFIVLIKIFLIGVFDRLRGDPRGFGGFNEALCMGVVLFSLIYPDATIPGVDLPKYYPHLLFGILWAAGSAPGWGEVIGPILGRNNPVLSKRERWQNEYLLNRPWLSAFVRGAIWGLPTLLIIPLYPRVIIPFLAMIIAFPLALLIGRELDRSQWKINTFVIAETPWGKHEPIRGWLCGSISLLMTITLSVIS
jgi:hypothetical protein